MVKSIFDLEKRTDVKKEVIRLEKYLNTKQFYIMDSYYSNHTFEDMVNSCLEFWPYRYTATSLEEFFELIQLPKNISNYNEEQCLFYLQFILDFIMWLSSDDLDTFFKENISNLKKLFKNNKNTFLTIINNIALTVELLNYSVEKNGNHYTFVKRDADVDSVLSTIENENDLRLSLLEYNDFRIENDKEAKKQIILRIGNYIELNKAKYKEKNNTLFKNISNILNNFNIRHSNENQINVKECDIISVYDICFKMMIHLIRDPYIKDAYNVLIDTYQK